MSTTSNFYRHYYCYRYHPFEPSVTKVATPLPSYIALEIVTEGDSKYLIVHSTIHVKKTAKMEPSYSDEFSDEKMIAELSEKIYYAYIK